jgi:hypothetical protein
LDSGSPYFGSDDTDPYRPPHSGQTGKYTLAGYIKFNRLGLCTDPRHRSLQQGNEKMKSKIKHEEFRRSTRTLVGQLRREFEFRIKHNTSVISDARCLELLTDFIEKIDPTTETTKVFKNDFANAVAETFKNEALMKAVKKEIEVD